MFKSMLLMSAMLAVWATGFVVAGSAAAEVDHYLICEKTTEGHAKYANHECKEEGGSKDWEKKALRSGESIELGAEGGPSTLETGSFTIDCGVDKTEYGTLHGAGTSNYFIEFASGSCKVAGKSACIVSNYYLNLEGALGATLIEDPNGPVTFNEFALLRGSEVTISGCSVKGTYKFAGDQTCKMPKLSAMMTLHEMICPPTASDIEIEGGEKGVKFADTEQVHVVFEPFWGAER